MSTFSAHLDNIAGMAIAVINSFMDGKTTHWMADAQKPIEDCNNADEIEINSSWPSFDNEDGDLTYVYCIDRNEQDKITLQCIWVPRRQSQEWQEYTLDDLSVEALASVCDDLELQPLTLQTPETLCVLAIVKAHLHNDPASMQDAIEACYEVTGHKLSK